MGTSKLFILKQTKHVVYCDERKQWFYYLVITFCKTYVFLFIGIQLGMLLKHLLDLLDRAAGF
jgi:hypothetical protein